MLARILSYAELLRLNSPTGIWLLLWPAWWSIAMASGDRLPSIWILGLFALGAIVMRAAGCVVNDIIDKDIDAKVWRTKERPLASGRVSIKEAVLLELLLLAVAFWVLLQFNEFTITLGLISLIPVVIYPFMKRITHWPQAFLAFSFNWGALMGWAAVTDRLHPAAGMLYMAGFFWTIGYDTIYAHQDKYDDIKAGVKSTALKFGKYNKAGIFTSYLLVAIFFALAGYFMHLGAVYYVAVALAALHLIWQVKAVDLETPAHCMRMFKSNRHFGWIIFLGIIAEKLL